MDKNHYSRLQVNRLRPGTSPATTASECTRPVLGIQQRMGNIAFGRLLQAKMKINQPGDEYEQEADRVAQQVLQMKEAPCSCGGNCEHCRGKKKNLVQRKTDGSGGGKEISVPDSFVSELGPGAPLDRATRTFFEHRFGNDFSQVRVHTDGQAADSASAVNALAYTVGRDVVFGAGQYKPDTSIGKQLLAHELAHTLQQSDASRRGIMRTWDRASPECSEQTAKDKWIDKVVVNQEGSQKVTIHWTDGSEESDECSTGKGHCCVDDTNPTGVTCTVEGSHVDGSNCTPITQHKGFPVKNRVLDHRGVHFWTEFEPARAIALHQYDDQGTVNGSPLSHGCVRLHEAMAKKIFCNVRQNKTWVQILGFARPKCNDPSLQKEWLNDFAIGGMDFSKADGDLNAEIVEIRRELSSAFGRTLTPGEIRKFTAADIPRCTRMAPLPKPPTTP